MPKPGKTGVVRLFDAFGYSIKGFRAAWANEAAFRQEAVLALVLLPGSFFLARTGLELALLIGGVMLVLVTELLNSAIEAIVDKTTPEIHELAGRAKDMGSAAVLCALIACGAIWLFIALDRFAPGWFG
ncbi:diacylglycerol kinase [Permianibacter sp. IMCC34836]|uniref:diacylglycerol kinase n=1 Tax=Permianibacter fluminis TaxID=2738515 RepID=UPI0015563EF6|nr:diacylglycerol kinase [Permianibacter fluminis]NQD36522.1 diacylglycerol kinase [Permianibacter fluminis]